MNGKEVCAVPVIREAISGKAKIGKKSRDFLKVENLFLA